MFIDSASSSITRAPAERNFSIIGTWLPSYVSLRWSEEKFLRGRAFYKHLAPNGAKSNNVLLHLPDGSQRQSLAPAAIISRLSAWISSIIASVTADGSKSSGR